MDVFEASSQELGRRLHRVLSVNAFPAGSGAASHLGTVVRDRGQQLSSAIEIGVCPQ
jgi:hypothetical protein